MAAGAKSPAVVSDGHTCRALQLPFLSDGLKVVTASVGPAETVGHNCRGRSHPRLIWLISVNGVTLSVVLAHA